jgi:lambda family phage tail tape measure protein
MTEERRIQLVAEVDATGARTGLNEISREAGTMAASVARSSEQAEAAVAGVGGGATRSAQQVEANTRNLIASIQRQTAALEAGSRSGSAYYDVLARQRGVDPARLDRYLAQLHAVEAAQVSATAAQQAAAEAALNEAAAQREVAKAQAGRDAFLSGLREQIQIYGRSSEEILRYRAAQAGEADAAAPMILQLQNIRVAHEAAADAARAEANAERQAAQAQTSRESLLTGLREQIALYGKSTEEVLRYRAAQAGAADAAAPLIAQLERMRAAQAAVAEEARASERAQQQAAQAQAGRDTFIANLQQQSAAIGRTRAELLELQAAQLGVAGQAAPFIARLREAEQGLNNTGMSARATAAALRGVPAQFTDIVVSLQGGQAPLTVLLQQGGQLRDMFGSTGGAARALGGYVRGLITPYTLAAAAAVGLAYAHHVGAEEAQAYSRALILSNNAAGATGDGLAEAARRIGQISGNQGAAAGALVQLAETGRVPAESMQRFAQVAVEAQKVIGRSVTDTVADFAALGKTPLETLDQINQKYRFITASTYAQVKALQDQGRAAEAADVAQQAYADGIDKQRQKVLDSLSDWERGWIRIKKAAAGALDSVLDFGRGATDFEKLNALLTARETIEANMARAEQERDKGAVARYQKQLDRNKNDINAIRAKGDAARQTAQEEKESDRLAEAKNKWLKDGDQFLTRAAQLERDVTRARNEGAAAGESQAEIEKRVGNIRKRYSDIFNDGIDSNIEALKRRAAVEDVLTQRAVAAITARRGAGDIREEDSINQTADAEDQAFQRRRANLVAELALAKGKQNSLKEQQSLSGQIDVLDAQRTSAQLGRGYALAALTRQRLLDSDRLRNAGVASAQDERQALIDQIKAQRESNEEIGLVGGDLLNVRLRRAEVIAGLKEESAAALEAIEPGGALAQQYRDQAAAMRKLSDENRAGFVKERDPYANLISSVRRYGDEASNVGAQVGDALTNSFRSAEDAFVQFATTGKLSFKSLASSILADIARIQAKKAIAGLINMAIGAFSGGSQPTSGPGTSGWDGYGNTIDVAGARAAGGPVTGGLPYLVGEKGPEVFTPSTSGRIIANHALGGGSGGDVNITMVTNVTSSSANTEVSGGDGTQARAAADALNAKFKQVIAQEMRQGGLLWNMKMGRG